MTNETSLAATGRVDRSVRGPQDWIRIQREYIQAIQPYLNMKTRVYSAVMPTIVMHADGRIEHHYNLTDAQKETLRLVDEGIEGVQRSMGLTPNEKLTGLAPGKDEQ